MLRPFDPNVYPVPNASQIACGCAGRSVSRDRNIPKGAARHPDPVTFPALRFRGGRPHEKASTPLQRPSSVFPTLHAGRHSIPLPSTDISRQRFPDPHTRFALAHRTPACGPYERQRGTAAFPVPARRLRTRKRPTETAAQCGTGFPVTRGKTHRGTARRHEQGILSRATERMKNVSVPEGTTRRVPFFHCTPVAATKNRYFNFV